MDINDYRSIKAALEQDFCGGSTEDGDLVTIGWGPYGSVRRTIYQKNGWARSEYFHEDGTYEEMYERYEEIPVRC